MSADAPRLEFRSTFSIFISDRVKEVTAELTCPEEAFALLILAHGAGADMNHSFMVNLSLALAKERIATLRYNFPFTEQHKKRPDPPAVAEKTVQQVAIKAHELCPALPLFGAGKSFGGRMTSQWLAHEKPDFIKGMIFYGFPLHPAHEPSTARAQHLNDVKIPMLFLQGTRDALADNTLMLATVRSIPHATLVKLEGADHAFKSGKKEFIPELAQATREWIKLIVL